METSPAELISVMAVAPGGLAASEMARRATGKVDQADRLRHALDGGNHREGALGSRV